MTKEQIEELFIEAAKILTLGDFDKALELFEKVLELDSNHVKALEAKAVILMQKERIDEAQEVIERALKIFDKVFLNIPHTEKSIPSVPSPVVSSTSGSDTAPKTEKFLKTSLK